MAASKGLVLIPAYNEELNLAKVYHELRQTLPQIDILVINDGSSDKTAQVAKKQGANVLSLMKNLGYGAALQAGFKYALRHGYEYVIQFDADGQHDPVDIPKLISHLEQTNADIVIGSRYCQDSGYIPHFLRMIGTRVFSNMIQVFTGQRITDPTSGFQVVNKKVFSLYAKDGVYPTEFPDANILIFMISIGVKVEEVPVVMRPRMTGQGMHIGMYRNIRYVIMMFYSICLSTMKAWLFKREGLHQA